MHGHCSANIWTMWFLINSEFFVQNFLSMIYEQSRPGFRDGFVVFLQGHRQWTPGHYAPFSIHGFDIIDSVFVVELGELQNDVN